MAPEAAKGGPLAKLRDGDLLRVDARAGTLDVLTEGWQDRPDATPDLAGNGHGVGRELFEVFRRNVGLATDGAAVVV